MKFYRVKKDNFLWKAGAILKDDESKYRPDTDLWDNTEYNGAEYISRKIIENNPEWFERVYEINLLSKVVYKLKEEARGLINDQFK